jgi:thiamine biosynthesis lipoprotein ApbE
MALDIESAQLAIVLGGVATSGTLRRCWRDADGTARHHLLDPATAQPAHHDREIVAVTVVAGTAAWAEVWTKAVMVRGAAMLQALDRLGLGVQLSYADRSIAVNDSWRMFAASGEQRGDLVGDEVEMVEV